MGYQYKTGVIILVNSYTIQNCKSLEHYVKQIINAMSMVFHRLRGNFEIPSLTLSDRSIPDCNGGYCTIDANMVECHDVIQNVCYNPEYTIKALLLFRLKGCLR